MAEKNDDIKQLFAHLGLNPGDYKELRNPPKTTAAREESVESRRNWSLLRAVRVGTADQAASAPAAAVPVRPVPASLPATATAAAPAAPPRVEVVVPPGPTASTGAERDVRDLSRAELERESLQSFFEAVKEPVSPAALNVPQDAPSIPQTTERHATEHLLDELRRVPETAAARVADLVRSRWPQDRVSGGRPEVAVEPALPRVTPAVAVAEPAVAPPASRPTAAPTPVPTSTPPPFESAPPASAGLLRLQFGAPKPAAAAAPDAGTETLADVFRRLAGPARSR